MELFYSGLLCELQWSLSGHWIFIYCFLFADWFWGSSVCRGGSAEIYAEVLVEFPQGRTHRGCDPVRESPIQERLSPFTGEEYYTHATQDEDHEIRNAGPGIGAVGK